MLDSERDTDILNSLLNSVGEGEGRMIWENDIETCNLSYMKFRMMVTMTLYVRQQKRHTCIEQSFGLCGRRQGCDYLRE